MGKEMTEPLLVVVGQTASGKTSLAIELAGIVDGEIICADSRTIYKGMDIGTAKPSILEAKGIVHHLLSIIEPGEVYTAADFQDSARSLVRDISSRGKIPILVGGSGLYVDSVIYDYEFLGINSARSEINPRHLKDSDSQPRVMRENTLVMGIELDRSILHKRIEDRVRSMFDQGIVEEAQNLSSVYGWSIDPMKTYLPIRDYLNGDYTMEQTIQRMVIKDRQLAKKQKTWFKRNNSIHWASNTSNFIDLSTTFLNTRL